MGLSLETKDAMLRSQFGGQCWIGLLTEGGEEESDANYVRQAVTLDAEGLAGSATPDEARAKITAIRAEMAKLPEGHPRTKDMIDEILALTRIAHKH